MFSLDKYKFVSYKDKKGTSVIAAISSYAGKHVKGYAKANPNDEYNEEKGKKLAAARCNERIAAKKMKHAEKQLLLANKKYAEAEKYLKKMEKFHNDTMVNMLEAKNYVSEALTEM